MAAEPVNPSYANLTEADVRAAQTVLDAWEHAPGVTPAELLALRGLLAVQLADVRWAGYLEGVQEGRAQVIDDVRRALDDVL